MRALAGLVVIITLLFLMMGLVVSFEFKDLSEEQPSACDSEFWRCLYSADGVACDRLKDKYPGGKIAPVCVKARKCWKWWEDNCR